METLVSTPEPAPPKSAKDMTPEEYRAARAALIREAIAQQRAEANAAVLRRLAQKWGTAAPAPGDN